MRCEREVGGDCCTHTTTPPPPASRLHTSSPPLLLLLVRQLPTSTPTSTTTSPVVSWQTGPLVHYVVALYLYVVARAPFGRIHHQKLKNFPPPKNGTPPLALRGASTSESQNCCWKIPKNLFFRQNLFIFYGEIFGGKKSKKKYFFVQKIYFAKNVPHQK